MRVVRPARALSEPRPDAPDGIPIPQGERIWAIQEVSPGFVQVLIGENEVYLRQEDLEGVAQPTAPPQNNPPPTDPEPVPIAPAQLSSLSGTRALIHNAFKFVGTPYRWGGNSLRGGIDCSHFVQEIFRYTKFAKPPSAPVISQEQVGQVVHRKPGLTTIWRGMRSFDASRVPDNLKVLRVGDRFIHQKTPGQAISGHRHTGVYVGRVRYRGKIYNHGVIHSSGRRGIDVDELTGYLWKAYRYSVRDTTRATR
jgi:cell wall-associated NlpC family hydrolase